MRKSSTTTILSPARGWRQPPPRPASSPGPPDYDGDGRSLHYNVPSTLQDERKHAEGLVERDGAGLRAPRSAVQLQQLRQLPA